MIVALLHFQKVFKDFGLTAENECAKQRNVLDISLLFETLKELQSESFSHWISAPIVELKKIRVNVSKRYFDELPCFCKVCSISLKIFILVSLVIDYLSGKLLPSTVLQCCWRKLTSP